MNRSFLIVLLAGIALPAIGQAPGETERVWQPNAFVLTIKTGDLRLADDSQTISGNDRIFERSASTVFAIEGETRLQREAENVSFGGEILQYRRSEEHTSELQSPDHLVCRLLLEKKKKQRTVQYLVGITNLLMNPAICT